MNYLTIEYDDGTVARWQIADKDIEVVEKIITAIIGGPLTIKC